MLVCWYWIACLYLLGRRNFYRLVLINSDCFRDKGIQNERTFCTWMWRGGDSSILIKARVCFREGRQWEGEWFWNFIPSFIDSLLFRWTWNMRRTRQYGGSSCKDEHSVPWLKGKWSSKGDFQEEDDFGVESAVVMSDDPEDQLEVLYGRDWGRWGRSLPGCDAQRAWPKCMERGSIHGNTLLCERVVQVLLRNLCWPCIVLLNEMHIFCQTLYSWVFSHDGRLRAERFGCFWHGKTSLLGWFPGKKMDDMLWCCILDDMLTHSFLYAWLCCSLVNEHLQAVMDTNLKAAMNQEASSSGDIIVFSAIIATLRSADAWFFWLSQIFSLW